MGRRQAAEGRRSYPDDAGPVLQPDSVDAHIQGLVVEAIDAIKRRLGSNPRRVLIAQLIGVATGATHTHRVDVEGALHEVETELTAAKVRISTPAAAELLTKPAGNYARAHPTWMSGGTVRRSRSSFRPAPTRNLCGRSGRIAGLEGGHSYVRRSTRSAPRPGPRVTR